MRMRFIPMLSMMMLCQACAANSLVSTYLMESERYVQDLVVRCFDRHLSEESNAVDLVSELPVGKIDRVNIGASFAYQYVSVNFTSSKNILDRASGLSCIFDRASGDILGTSSYNWESSEKDRFYYPPEVKLSQRYDSWEQDLYFGFILDYKEVLMLLKKTSDTMRK